MIISFPLNIGRSSATDRMVDRAIASAVERSIARIASARAPHDPDAPPAPVIATIRPIR